MKSEHRHQLKTNELAEWIANFPQWARENLRMIISISVVAVLVIASAIFYWYRKNVEQVRRQLELTNLISTISNNKMQILGAHARGVDYSFVLIQPADNLRTLSQNTNNNQMAALALIKRAEALRMELHYRSGTVSKQDLTAQINRAKTSYTEAVEKSSPNPSLTAAAKFGLGLCEEELGNFEKAGQIYRDIAASPDFEGTTAAAQAKHRLETMADYQRKVVFNTVRSKTAASGPLTPETSKGVKAPPSPLRKQGQAKPTPTEIKQPQAELTQPEVKSTQPSIKPEVPDTNLSSQ